ncbi:MAG: FkbM family methyltransferase [Gammaproteobacteria bacterium]
MTSTSHRDLRHWTIALAAPAIRILPPWWKVRVYSRLTGSPFTQGGHAGKTVSTRIWPHRYRMELRLDDWMERLAFFVGCYYEIDSTAALVKLLRPGDCFIDVGANLGFMTLTGSRAVGPDGKVMAFEPNHLLASRLNDTLLLNDIRNVTVFENALGSADGSATLSTGTHSGTANLRGTDSAGDEVRVRRGDSFITAIEKSAWVLTKIDAEGYEQRILQGFSHLISRPRTAFLIEITDRWLEELGGSSKHLFAMLSRAGFHAYLPKLSRTGKMTFVAIPSPRNEVPQYDVLFVRPGETWFSR